MYAWHGQIIRKVLTVCLSWIIKSLKLIGINNKMIFLTKEALSYWKTSMHLHTEGKITYTEDLEI